MANFKIDGFSIEGQNTSNGIKVTTFLEKVWG